MAAEPEFRTVLAIYQKLANENAASVYFRTTVAASHTHLGNVLSLTGQPSEAESECRTAVAIIQKLADDNPAVSRFRDRLAYALINFGDVVRSLGRAAEAKGCYERAIALKEPQVREDPTNTEQRYVLVCAMRRHGLTLRDLGDPAGAAAVFRRALRLCTEVLPRSAWELCEVEMACCHAALAALSGRAGSGVSAAEAEDEDARAMDWLRRAVAMGYPNANQLRTESALDPLRKRADFKILLEELGEEISRQAGKVATKETLKAIPLN